MDDQAQPGGNGSATGGAGLQPDLPHGAQVVVLGDSLPYADGAESELLAIMAAASDRSTGSDELARAIRDWPTQYHLTGARATLLLPLQLGPGVRVLDFGCGTGALTRAIAETGADVVGLEGSYARAAVAAARVAGLPNAQVMCGTSADYLAHRPDGAPEAFDVIVVCGVLEYSGSASGGEGGPQTMLAELRSLLSPDGVLALAIENQWGLKYLASYPEDHLGRAWIGLEGYWRDRSGVRTWSQEQLHGLFADAGFGAQRWFAALPDYKTPTVMAAAELFDDAQGRSLVKQFVRGPMSSAGGGPLLAADDVLLFQSAVDAGLGMQTANSFFVVAGRAQIPVERLAEGALWLSTSQRTRRWRSVRALVRDGAGWSLRLRSGASAEAGPLRCSRDEAEPVLVGDNLEDLLRREVAGGGAQSAAAAELLRVWADRARQVLAQDHDGVHFDLMPNNFIRDGDGRWHMVDTEFRWTADVADDVVLFRSLWYTVERFASAGLVAGLDPATTQEGYARMLAAAGGIDLPDDIFERWLAFEQDLATLLLDWADEDRAAWVDRARADRGTTLQALREGWNMLSLQQALGGSPGEMAQLRSTVEQQQELIDRVHAVLDETREQWQATQLELDRHRLLLATTQDQLRTLRTSTSWRLTAPLRGVRRRKG
jgi:cyclopropane fatty-acyl-phospholipid synthase-like methyltransferase